MDTNMSVLYQAVLLALIAGIAIPAGGVLSSFENIRPHWLQKEFRHSVVAFGGGVLLSAVSLVLVPQGIEGVSLPVVTISFIAGGLFFMWLDKLVTTRIGPASQMIAMLVDFMPEAIALGAALSTKSNTALLLALLIALQNIPEGFNSYREIANAGKYSKSHILAIFLGLSLLGPICAVAGLVLLSGNQGTISVIMLSSSAGILYLTFQDIAPQVKLRNHWGPPLGAVTGFMVGLGGHMLLT